MMVHPEWLPAKPGSVAGPHWAALQAGPPLPVSPTALDSASPGPLATNGWTSRSPSPILGSFALLLFPRLLWGYFLLALLFSLLISEAVNLSFPGDCFSPSFPFHSRVASSQTTLKWPRKTGSWSTESDPEEMWCLLSNPSEEGKFPRSS